jgi:4'-phosphopantetheinyl transferase
MVRFLGIALCFGIVAPLNRIADVSVPYSALKGPTGRTYADGVSLAEDWFLPVEPVRLDPGHVHLWAVVLKDFVDEVSKFGDLLSPVEQTAAQKFGFDRDRNRYVIRHGVLRLIIGRYLRQPPAQIEFQLGAYGKPELRENGGSTPLFFNTSHSADIAVCAITSACPIGVDVESTREIPEIEGIAQRFFLSGETRTLMDLPAESRLQAFYAGWTRKEALLKATGKGIAEDLAKVEVTLAPEDEPRVVSISGEPGAHEQWRLQPFSPARGYVGCLAYRNSVLALDSWRVAKSTLWKGCDSYSFASR